jgi:putative transposase
MAGMNDGTISQLVQEVFKDGKVLKEVLETLLDQAMESEVQEHVGVGKYERGQCRRGRRNGYKTRGFQTRAGCLDLSVPQVRGSQPYHPSFFNRWQRSERALLIACAEMYFQGVSTRKVQEVLDKMCGGNVSAMTVSRVAAEIDQKLSAFRQRRLDAVEYPYLKIDARYEKVRVNGQVVSQAVLVTAGISMDGRREILDWRVDDSESEQTWGDLFRGLKDRGLRGLVMVVSDAHGGIRKALGRHFQGVPWQRCQVHFKRELMAKVALKSRKEVIDDLRSVLAGQDKSECMLRGQEMAGKWQTRYPRVSAMLAEGLEDCLTVLQLPHDHHRRMSSTNMLENLMKQLKKRTKVVGVFPNRSSCHRLIGALLVEVDEQWAVEEDDYLNMELLKPPAAESAARVA